LLEEGNAIAGVGADVDTDVGVDTAAVDADGVCACVGVAGVEDSLGVVGALVLLVAGDVGGCLMIPNKEETRLGAGPRGLFTFMSAEAIFSMRSKRSLTWISVELMLLSLCFDRISDCTGARRATEGACAETSLNLISSFANRSICSDSSL